MWSDVEAYRQAERDYQRALEEYQREEADYREALTEKGPDETALAVKYEQLQKMGADVKARYDRLMEMRRELASSREQGGLSLGA
jgi:hypothetical protein